MLKTSAKILLIFILLVIVAVATGFVTYTLTKRIADDDSVKKAETAESEKESDNPEAIAETAKVTDFKNENKSEKSGDAPEHYTVRLEGTTLGVYVINDGKEEFLYHADVYKNDLSAEDLNLLQQGVNLSDLSALTGFIENFTS